MSEVEEKLLQEGFPLIDQNDEGDCCEDDDDEGFSLLVEGRDGRAAAAGRASAMLDGGAGGEPIASLGSVRLGGAAQRLGRRNAAALAALHARRSAERHRGGCSAAVPRAAAWRRMVMGLVYPDLKPMLEASIRHRSR